MGSRDQKDQGGPGNEGGGRDGCTRCHDEMQSLLVTQGIEEDSDQGGRTT
jgi:hypothetical protein